MTFSQSQLQKQTNIISYAWELGKLFRQEIKNKFRKDYKTNLKYWYESYIKFNSVCPVCAEPYNGRLVWDKTYCRHEESGGGVTRVIGQKMAASEWDAKSEGLLDYDTEKAIERGEIRTANDLNTFARENGWNQEHEKPLIKKMQQKYRLK